MKQISIIPGYGLKEKFIKGIIQLLMLFFSPILSFIPRKKDLWIFGSNHGKKFADNSKYLYLYVNKNCPEIRAIWLTKNQKIIDQLNKKNYEVYKIFSLKSFWYSARAGYIITSHGLHDINKILIGGAKIIQLGHCTPFKDLRDQNLATTLRKISGSSSHYSIATSEESKRKVALDFGLPENHVAITGSPRNDGLFNKSNLLKNTIRDLKKRTKFKYIIAYFPTWRGDNTNLFEKYKFKVDAIEKKLKKLNAILIIKAHPMNTINIDKFKSSRIYNFSDEEVPDIYPFLKETDMLITDYSSVYFDFLLLNRPIIFAPFDIEEANKTGKAFFYNYNDVTPGPKAKDWIEVFNHIEKELKKDHYSAERKKICKTFNKFKDNKNSKRVFEFIKTI